MPQISISNSRRNARALADRFSRQVTKTVPSQGLSLSITGDELTINVMNAKSGLTTDIEIIPKTPEVTPIDNKELITPNATQAKTWMIAIITGVSCSKIASRVIFFK